MSIKRRGGRVPRAQKVNADNLSTYVGITVEACAISSIQFGGNMMAAIDEAKLQAFIGKAFADMGAAVTALLCFTGERLGLYRAMAGAGPLTSAELAHKSGTAERYVREWLGNQAASGYVAYDPASGKYLLPAEHAVALTDESSPFFIGGAFSTVIAAARVQPKIEIGRAHV